MAYRQSKHKTARKDLKYVQISLSSCRRSPSGKDESAQSPEGTPVSAFLGGDRLLADVVDPRCSIPVLLFASHLGGPSLLWSTDTVIV